MVKCITCTNYKTVWRGCEETKGCTKSLATYNPFMERECKYHSQTGDIKSCICSKLSELPRRQCDNCYTYEDWKTACKHCPVDKINSQNVTKSL